MEEEKNNELKNNEEKNIEQKNNNEAEKQVTENKKKAKGKISVGRIITRTILYAIIILCLAVLVRALFFHKYDVFGYRGYVIGSGSMEPTIKINDVIVVKKQNSYQKDDIIAFESEEGAVFAHRIIEIYTQDGKELYQTKGDFNNTIDKGLTSKDRVQGKVIKIIPGIKDIVQSIQKNFVIWTAVIIGLAAIIITWRLMKNGKQKE